jgi:hypothetical protein
MNGVLVVCLRGRALPGAVLALLLLASAIASSGCNSSPLLAHALSSDEAVARAVLDALARNDTQELIRLSLTKGEFEGIVWPVLPASRPDVGVTSDEVWRDTANKSRAHLARTLSELGGRRLELMRIEFGGATTEHGAYSLSRKTRLIVRNEVGAEERVRVFGSIIRQRGQSKVYSYIVD